MQAQKVRPPAQQVEQQLSVKLSTQVMQSALGVAIANVCYSRNLFTPDDYESKPMGPGLPMQRKLKPSDRTAELLSWLSDGVGPSLEKRYLQEVLFIISADEAGDQVLEVFSFQCEYNDVPNFADKLRSSKAHILQQANAMLSLLGAYTESSAPLPCQPTFLRVSLIYNERAPKDYTPGELFTSPKPSSDRELTFVDKAAMVDLRPTLTTPHQSLKTKLYSTCLEGICEDAAQLVDGKLPLGGQVRTTLNDGQQGGTSSPTFGNTAASQQAQGCSQGSAVGRVSKGALLKLYEEAETYCRKLGAGAIVNAALLQKNVSGMKSLDACMILCRLETAGVISALNLELGGRQVLVGAGTPRAAPH